MSTQTEIDAHEPEAIGLLAWWASPWGPGPLIQLALPLMISAGFASLILFTDRTLLYWQSELSASAALGGGSFYWALICLPMGLLGYISTFVSQYRGAKQTHRIGAVYRHAQILAWLIVPVLVLAFIAAHWLFRSAGHHRELAELESTYLRILLVGGVGVLFYSVQSGLLTGQGRTRIVLLIDAVATLVNLVLDGVLIFGFGPFPEMGIAGAALATTLAFWLKVPIASWIISRDRAFVASRGPIFGGRFEPKTLRRFVVFGAPAGLQLLAEASCFMLIMLQVGRLGETAMAATTLALGVNILAFVPLVGLGIGVGVMVGQRLTEGRVDLAKRTVWSGMLVSILYTGAFAAIVGLAPETTIWFYALGADPERFEQIRPLLLPLLRIVAAYCILDGFQVVFVGAIKGAGDTWFVLLATSLVSTFAVTAGLALESSLGNSLLLWWYVIAGWVTTMGIVFGGRFLTGGWTTKRVIEDAEASFAPAPNHPEAG